MAELLTAFMGAAAADEAAVLYGEIFLNTACASWLLQQQSDSVVQFITKCVPLVPKNWTSTRAAVKIRELCGANLVANLTKANEAWLYSLALAARIDPGTEFELTPQAAEASFGLSAVWSRAAGLPGLAGAGAAPGGPQGVPPGPVAELAGMDADQDTSGSALPRGEVMSSLPALLLCFLWVRLSPLVSPFCRKSHDPGAGAAAWFPPPGPCRFGGCALFLVFSLWGRVGRAHPGFVLRHRCPFLPFRHGSGECETPLAPHFPGVRFCAPLTFSFPTPTPKNPVNLNAGNVPKNSESCATFQSHKPAHLTTQGTSKTQPQHHECCGHQNKARCRRTPVHAS